MSTEDVARELYGLAPEEFTAARNARAKEAKAAGDSELAAAVQALRKPTTGAWLLNQLVREHGDEVAQVLELGARLRAAQGSLGADELRALDRQRRQLTHAVAQQARALGVRAGRRVTTQVTDAVEETLRSAMVDAAAGEALSTGLLVDTFSSTGIEPVDLAGVVALGAPAARAASGRPSTGSAATPGTEGEPDLRLLRRIADAERALAQSESAREAARDVSMRSAEEAAGAERRRTQLEGQRDEARRRLENLDEQLAAAAEAEKTAARVRDRAERDAASAADAAERLREELEELRRHR